MIIADLNGIDNLLRYNENLQKKLQDAHGVDYIEYLQKLDTILSDCNTYREIGTWQGASTSVALLKKINYVETIDISFNTIKPYLHIFQNFAKKENIKLITSETDSLKHKVEHAVDFLLIDGYHSPKQVEKELNKYAPYTKKYIMCHDTTLVSTIQKVVNNFLINNKDWVLESQSRNNVGYIVIKKNV
jgi:hypothetical protein